MKTIEIRNYTHITEIVNNLREEHLKIDFKGCDNKIKIRILDFLSGLIFKEGSMKKISSYEFIINLKGERENV